MTTSNPVKNKIIIDVCQDKIDVLEFNYYAHIISDYLFQRLFDFELKIPRDGFKISGDLNLLTESARRIYKKLTVKQAINNVYLIKK